MKKKVVKKLMTPSDVKSVSINEIMSINNVIMDMAESRKLPAKTFTYDQLSRISDDNYGLLNRCINMSLFNSDDVFILTPIMYHHHGYGKPIKKHLRTQVSILSGKKCSATQDLTLEQWQQGQEFIVKAA